jgi:hypothetical protein
MVIAYSAIYREGGAANVGNCDCGRAAIGDAFSARLSCSGHVSMGRELIATRLLFPMRLSRV